MNRKNDLGRQKGRAKIRPLTVSGAVAAARSTDSRDAIEIIGRRTADLSATVVNDPTVKDATALIICAQLGAQRLALIIERGVTRRHGLAASDQYKGQNQKRLSKQGHFSQL